MARNPTLASSDEEREKYHESKRGRYLAGVVFRASVHRSLWSMSPPQVRKNFVCLFASTKKPGLFFSSLCCLVFFPK